MRRMIAVALAVIALILAVPSRSEAITSAEQSVVTLVNEARAHGRYCGTTYMPAVRPLRVDGRLVKAARRHSMDMATKGYFSHYSPSGAGPLKRALRAGYPARRVGEDIAAGRSVSDPGRVVKAWLKSPGHCKVLMRPYYRDVGAGRAIVDGSRWTAYWTLDFGRKR